MLALSTRSGIAGVSVFAVSLATVSGFFWHGLLSAGLLRGCLLSFVQAWEGEIRNLVHGSRSSQSLLIDLVDPRFYKAWAGYSRRNDKLSFISDFCDQWPQGGGHKTNCGSEFARDSGSTSSINVTEESISRASSLPQGMPTSDGYLQTSAMASASKSRRVASIPATFARPELTM
jgi:hypothetical protein